MPVTICEDGLRLDIPVNDVPHTQRMEAREVPPSVAPDGLHVQGARSLSSYSIATKTCPVSYPLHARSAVLPLWDASVTLADTVP